MVFNFNARNCLFKFLPHSSFESVLMLSISVGVKTVRTSVKDSCISEFFLSIYTDLNPQCWPEGRSDDCARAPDR